MKTKKLLLSILMATSFLALSSCDEAKSNIIEYKSDDLKTVDAYRLALSNRGLSDSDVVVGSSEVSEDNSSSYIVTIATSQGEETFEVNTSSNSVNNTTSEEEGGSLSDTQTTPASSEDTSSSTSSDIEAPLESESPEVATPINVVEAYSKALEASGVVESDIVNVNITTKFYKGYSAIEVEFATSNVKYRYIYNQADGTLFESKINIMYDGNAEESESSYITEDKAKSVCLETVGVEEASVSDLTVKEDRKRDMKVFKVEFTYNGYEYNFLVNAITANIVRYEVSIDKVEVNYETNTELSIDDAKAVVLTYFGKTSDEVEFIKVKLHKNYYEAEYEVKVVIDGRRYELEVNAQSGEIKDFEMDEHHNDEEDHEDDYDDDFDDEHGYFPGQPGEHSNDYGFGFGPNEDRFQFITKKEALEKTCAALEISADNVDYYFAEIDFYQRKMCYYVFGITKDNKEFGAAVDVETGDVLDKYIASLPDLSNIIDQSEALNIALKHSCFSKKDVRIISIDLEYDDDICYYVVVFQNKSIVYEYEINAKTKEIISYSNDYE